jgi:hypothetical protein
MSQTVQRQANQMPAWLVFGALLLVSLARS